MIRMPSGTARQVNFVLVEAGDMIPADGEVFEGIASVNEAAVTVSVLVIRGERRRPQSVTGGGTTVISDWIILCASPPIRARPSSTAMATTRVRVLEDTRIEIALDILLAGLTIVPLATVTSSCTRSSPPPALDSCCTILVRRRAPSDPHHDRRAALGDRHRGHGPHDPGQRDRHLGRAVEAATVLLLEQDRQHGRQSAGHGLPGCAGRTGSSPKRPSSPRSPTRRPRAEHRRARGGALRRARPRRPGARRPLRPLQRPDAHQR